MKPSSYLFILAQLMLLFSVSCAHKPLEELSLADLALKSAQKARADGFVPELYRKAENYYLRAKKDYDDGYFDSSKKFADQARKLAEQAEYKSIAKQTQAKEKVVSPTAPPADAPETYPLPKSNP